jgi:hypothetical protein
VVLADPEDVQPDLVSERDLLDELGKPLGSLDPVRIRADIGEGEDANFHGACLSFVGAWECLGRSFGHHGDASRFAAISGTTSTPSPRK